MRKGLTRKAHLAHNARKWAAKHPGGRLAAAVPETWPLELDDPEYVDEALCDVPEVPPGAVLWQAGRLMRQWRGALWGQCCHAAPTLSDRRLL